ncbi:hypothetical protein PBI_LAMBO_60 [Gordonia phage Lambo]|uniref:Uncharacterized protein n=1 Tax=Gordonia phage Lambo TaxID=2599845 RepID=A0A5J6TUN2_9CAUD|nr:hypothetical protein HWC70_gp60 [Gordonia phage Lambo]QFG13569.1 hypothetical protein PBI_LAMBO_60 [Gordonia phage Lambo]
MLEWFLALGFSAIGFIGGWCLGYAMKMDKIKEQMVQEYHEEQEHRKRLQLERNGRNVPKRPDAAPGASRVHSVKTGRNMKPRGGGR